MLPPPLRSLRGISGITPSAEDMLANTARRPAKKLSSPERFEATQLIARGVLSVQDYPTFDEDNHGLLGVMEDEAEQEFEIDINESEPPFLAGQTAFAAGGDASPIKIVKNPDGSMSRAAMTQASPQL